MKLPGICRLLAVLFATSPVFPANGANIDDFLVFNYDHRNDGSVELPGRLFVPLNYDPARSYPLVIHFHGVNYRGTNNTSQIAEIGKLIDAARDPENPFFLYVPQLPSGNWPGTAVDRAMRMFSRVSALYSIDQSRMYTTGISLGGGGVWDTMSRYGGALAGAVPIAGVEHNPAYSLLFNKPIWIYHGVFDSTVSVSSSRNRVNGMRAAQGKPALTFPLNNLPPSDPYYSDGTPFYPAGSAGVYDEDRLRYTEFTSGGHSQAVWDRSLSDPLLLPWLFANPNPLEDASLRLNESIFFDFGGTAVTTSGGTNWNGTTSNSFDTPGTTIAFGKEGTGRITTVSLDIVRRFAGDTTGGSTALYANLIGTDGWQTPDGLPGELRVRGLRPNGVYRLEAYASHPDNDEGRGRRTRYTIGKESHELEASGNTIGQAVFPEVQANSKGEITLSVAPVSGARFGQINTLKVTFIAPPQPTDALFEQTFEDGQTVASYTAASPGRTLFHEIIAPAQGGEWSIHEGALRLSREAVATPAGPTAGFLRLSGPLATAPEVVTARFTLGVNLRGAYTFGVLGVVELGDFLTPGALEASPVETSQALQIRGNGSGHFRFAIGDLPFGNIAEGTAVEVTWMINHSSQPREYVGLDGVPRTLSPGCSDLWAGETLVLDNRPAPDAFGGTRLGGLRFRTTTPHGVEFLFDNFRMEEGLPGHQPVFRQDFSLSPHYRDYIDPGTPLPDKFHNISAEINGGTWSIDDGKLRLERNVTSVTPDNAAGFIRLRPPMGEAPEVVCARFELMVDMLGTHHFVTEGFLEFGDFATVTDYSSTSAPISEQLIIRGAGGGRFALRMNEVNHIVYDSGTVLPISWMINRSAETQTYHAPDGSTESLPPNSSDLWVGETLIADDEPSPTGGVFTGTKLGGFRFRTATTITIHFTFDKFSIENRLPQPPQSLPLQVDSFASWQETALGALSPDDRLPDADPDGDGVTNLLEYALDRNPVAPETGAATFVAPDGDGHLRLSYLRPVGKANLSYEVEASSDLVSWTPQATPLSVSPEGDAWEAVVIRDTELLTGETPRYLRLRVTEGGETAVTLPYGILPLEIPGGGASCDLSAPLLRQPVVQGRVDGISGDTIQVAGAAFAPLAEADAPHFLRFLSGEQEGRVVRITANTEETLTVDLLDRSTQSTPLTGLAGFSVAPGDRFQVIPAHTLGTLLGTTAEELPIRGGANTFVADTLQLWNGATSRFDTYFFNTALPVPAWNRSGGPAEDLRHQPIPPGERLLFTTKGTSPGGLLVVEGEAPAGRFLLKMTGAGSQQPFGHPFPVPVPLSAYGATAGPLGTVQTGANAFVADTFQIYNPSLSRNELFFLHSGGSWRLSGDASATDYSSKPVEAGAGLIFIKKAAVSGANSFLPVPQPGPERYNIK